MASRPSGKMLKSLPPDPARHQDSAITVYHRLARDVPAQCSSRTRRVVHPFACTRVAAIRRSAEGPQTETDRHVTRQLAYRALCRGADDVLQPVQSRYSGPLSDLPTKAA